MSLPRPAFQRPMRPLMRVRTPVRVLVPLLVALGAAGCELVLNPEQYGTVHVTATTTDGAPAAGLPVELYTGQRPIEYATTDSAGQYTFERVPPALNNYAVAISLPPVDRDSGQYYMYSPGFDVLAQGTHEIAFVVGPCVGSVFVRVLDQDGRPMANVGTLLYSADRPQIRSTTGSDGTTTFIAVACDGYGVQVLPGTGYVMVGGRDSTYVDGFWVHRGGRTDITLRVHS